MLIGSPNFSKDSIHSSIAAEIAGVTEKATPVAADLLLIEDSAAANEKKRLQIGSISHSLLSDIGSNSHSTIDSHIGNAALHFTQASIATVGTITSGVWNGTALGAGYVPNHDSLNGFVANEHIDWTAATSRLKTILPTEQLRIGYSESVYAGFTVDSAGFTNITNTGGKILFAAGANTPILELTTTDTTNNVDKMIIRGSTFAGGSPQAEIAFTRAGATYGEIRFATQQNGTLTESLRINYAGNIGINTPNQFGGGVKVIGIANATTVPTTNPTGGAILYVDPADGATKIRGSSGTVTTIAVA